MLESSVQCPLVRDWGSPTHQTWEAYIICQYLSKAKVITITEVINKHMWSHGDTPMCQIWYAYVKEERRSCPYTNSWWKYNFDDIEAKDQGHTEVMNVCYTSSHGDTLMCQTWYDYIKVQKSCALNMKPCLLLQSVCTIWCWWQLQRTSIWLCQQLLEG